MQSNFDFNIEKHEDTIDQLDSLTDSLASVTDRPLIFAAASFSLSWRLCTVSVEIFSMASENIFLSVNEMMVTSLGKYFSTMFLSDRAFTWQFASLISPGAHFMNPIFHKAV